MKRFLVAGIALAVIALIVIVNFTAVFDVRDIRAVGVDGPTSQLIIDSAAIANGTPLARVNPGAVATSVQREVPEVGSIQVQRKWPHTVVIKATPRRVAANVSVDGVVRWADQTGFVFGSIDKPRTGVPTIIVKPDFASDLAGRQGAIADALTVFQALPPAVKRALARIEYRSQNNIVITTKSRRTIRWGSAADSTRKALVLAALLGRKARFYDVRTPDLPTTKK